MTKAWLTCVLLCGVWMQVNATENNNHADFKELLKPAPFNNVTASHASEPVSATVETDLEDPVVFTELTQTQQDKIKQLLKDTLASLDQTQLQTLRKQVNLPLSPDYPFTAEQLLPVLMAMAALPNTYALNQLGDMYKLGQGLVQDRKKAFDCYSQSAKLGSTYAMNNLGECYSYGIGCTTDLSIAAHWYHEAARRGNVEAQFNLGYVYEYGEGVPLDPKQARYWYEKAASQQHADSMLFLGQMYLGGEGVPLDEALAKDYFGRACDLGSDDGCDLFRVMLSENEN